VSWCDWARRKYLLARVMKTRNILIVLLVLIIVAAAWLGWTGYTAATQARLADMHQLQALAENPSSSRWVSSWLAVAVRRTHSWRAPNRGPRRCAARDIPNWNPS
jgi:hypothetical protein